MSGEKDLKVLLASMEPGLDEAEFVFCTSALDMVELAAHRPWALVAEDEATTAILRREDADRAGLAYEAVFRRITLRVHSSLEAVGLTAAVSSALARAGISANIVAAAFHDHIFVQKERALEALGVLAALAEESHPS